MEAERTPESRENVLELRQVHKSFDYNGKSRENLSNHKVLNGINLKVRKGEFVTVVGPSGCGKSTLLNIISGLDRPESGEVFVKRESKLNSVGNGVIVIFQEGALFPWLSVQENIEFGLKMAGVEKDKRSEVASRFIEMVGLAKFAKSYVFQLSGGMKQRVEIARSLAAGPDVLYMDEPFGALDFLTRLRMRAELSEIWQREKKTVLFVTHDVEEAVFLGSNISVMTTRPGRIKSSIAVDLPRPRDYRVLTTDGFRSLMTKVVDAVHDEAQKAFAAGEREIA